MLILPCAAYVICEHGGIMARSVVISFRLATKHGQGQIIGPLGKVTPHV